MVCNSCLKAFGAIRDKTRIFSILPVLLLTLLSTSIFADERILNFHSDITVHEDASMTVTETITVRAEGNQIKRGIYRDFPTRYNDESGKRYNVEFDVLSVKRGGERESYFVESITNGKRVYIGRKNYFLPRGQYTYELTYKTDRQLGFFDDYDELYWNVTGNDWLFEIDQASATVFLPDGVNKHDVQLFAYTGRQGKEGTDYNHRFDDLGRPTFNTTATLRAREGLTISVAWPTGFVQRPSGVQSAINQFKNHTPELVGGGGLLGVLLYYVIIWLRVGRDPEKGTIIPRFEPPKGLSPAAVRYISKMGFDNRAFAAAVINMAVKGYISIVENDKKYTLRQESIDESVLSKGESKLARKLFRSYRNIELKKTNHKIISSAIDALKYLFEAEYHRVYFFKNSGFLIAGILAVIIIVVTFGMTSGVVNPESFGMIVWISIWSIGVYFLWAQRQIVMAIIFTAIEIGALVSFIDVFSVWQVGLLIILIGINIGFYFWLKAPTLLGRKIMDEIDGFKMYLEVAEEDRLNELNPPEKTPELFENYLPYALALGVEQNWSEKFSDVLAKAVTDEGAYHPGWYSGSGWDSGRISGFTSSLGSSLSSAVASSSVAPGSSSGVGGGGFSGGGGGGGGGGGW